jgi:hypothetical protein
MTYSIIRLTTTDECDAVLKQTQTKLKELNHQAYLSGYEQEESDESATSIQVSLIGVDADIAGLNTKLGVLPADSILYKKQAAKLRDAVNRRAGLLDRQEAKGSVALLVQELELSQVQVQIAEITAFVAAVTAHKATL